MYIQPHYFYFKNLLTNFGVIKYDNTDTKISYYKNFYDTPTVIAVFTLNMSQAVSSNVTTLYQPVIYKISSEQFYVVYPGTLPSVLSGALYVAWIAIGRLYN